MINLGPCLVTGFISLPVMGFVGLLYLILFGLGIYLIVSAIQFFRRNAQNHKQLMQKLDELSNVLKQHGQA